MSIKGVTHPYDRNRIDRRGSTRRARAQSPDRNGRPGPRTVHPPLKTLGEPGNPVGLPSLAPSGATRATYTVATRPPEVCTMTLQFPGGVQVRKIRLLCAILSALLACMTQSRRYGQPPVSARRDSSARAGNPQVRPPDRAQYLTRSRANFGSRVLRAACANV